MSEDLKREIDDISDLLINGRESNRKCTLLVGAGCSSTAGIPLAAGFIKEIERRYKRAYSRASPKNYSNCMGQLPPGHRRDLIHWFVERAHVNEAHHAIALLMKAGYIERVLTTNFDNLLLRASNPHSPSTSACALRSSHPQAVSLSEPGLPV